MTGNITRGNLNEKVLSSVVRLYFDKLIVAPDFQPKDLRGAIAGLYKNQILLHQHEEDGSLKYIYPLVQYKYIQGNCMLVGIQNGAKLISDLGLVGETISMFREKYRIVKKDVSLQEFSYGIKTTISLYSFLTPWFALNEKNYEKYQMLGSWGKKRELLEKILIGNIISMSKSLGYTVPAPIETNIHNLKETKTSLKGTPIIGFLGTFSVNFEIPDYWGIGKSVSRGFGTVVTVNSGQ
jgi:hypothetical protein